MNARYNLQLRLDIWFELNTRQQRKLSTMGYSHLFLEEVLIEDFIKVTKSKQLLSRLQELKRRTISLVA